MSVVRALGRGSARGRLVALIGLVVIVGLGTATTLAAASTAERSRTAYQRYVDAADVAPLVLNPSLLTADVDRAIRSLPGIESARVDHYLLATLDDGHPRSDVELQDELLTQVRGSTDGRYILADRPAIVSGRLPTGRHEAFLSAEAARSMGHEVGDTISVAFWPGALANEPTGDVVRPLGVETVRIVGTGVLADEVLPDDLYPRARVIVSADVTRRYTCLPENPGRGATFEESVAALLPPDCALLYPYYSLQLDDRPGAVPRALAAFATRANALGRELPDAITQQDYGYFAIPTTTAAEQARIARSIGPSVAIALIFAGAAAVTTLVLTALVAARILRRRQPEVAIWQTLGATRRTRAAAIGLPVGLAALGGVALAIPLALAATAIGPLGVVKAIEPEPGMYLSVPVTAIVVGGGVLVLGAAIGILVWRAARVRARSVSRAGKRNLVGAIARAAPAPVGYGVASATEFRRSADGLAVVGAAVASLAALAGAVVFGVNLGALVDEPARYGWPWDAAAVVGYGYGGADIRAITADLERRDGVDGWSAFGATNEVTVAGDAVPTIVDFGPDRIGVPVLDGRRPRGRDELALGRRTAAALGVGPGDHVRIGGLFGRRRMTVSGIVVLPAFGPFLSDRSGLGTGALLPEAVARESGSTPGRDASLIVIRLADGADGADRLFRELGPRLTRWDVTGFSPFRYTTAVRPPEIANIETMRRGPVLVASVLALGVLVALGLALGLSVRSRRRDLTILRVIGFTPTQVRRSVLWQSVTTVAIGVVVGVPVGTFVGIATWRRFAISLGADPQSAIPLAILLALVACALMGAVLTSVAPGVSASRFRPADALRPAGS